MKPSKQVSFDQQYQSHLKHLKLKGLQPKTIDAYAHAIRRVGAYFDHQIDALSEAQLTDYFTDLIGSHSWTTVKLDLYGLKFYYAHVLRKPWVASSTTQRMPCSPTISGHRRCCRTSALPATTNTFIDHTALWKGSTCVYRVAPARRAPCPHRPASVSNYGCRKPESPWRRPASADFCRARSVTPAQRN
jgi:hypothetical protein